MALNPIMQKIADRPLYDYFGSNKEEAACIENYLDHANKIKDDSIELYCVGCMERSVFKPVNYGFQSVLHELPSIPFFESRLPVGVLHFACSRDASHYFGMQFRYIKPHIVKIGQYPSKGDIENPDFDRFSKIIPPPTLKAVKRAVGLAAHGVGAGSFVYLRRVIEFLISEAKDRAAKECALDLEEFSRARVIEKMEKIKDYLPKILFENKEAYSILSKGIHELTDDECLSAFSLLKETIEYILEERLAQSIQAEKLTQIQKSISRLHSELKNS